MNGNIPGVAEAPASPVQSVFVTLIDLLDRLRVAKSLGDVNIAAGMAWQDLASAELGLFAAKPVEISTRSHEDSLRESVELAAHRPDELGEVVDFPL